jgi:glycerol uptake operon antiterminator
METFARGRIIAAAKDSGAVLRACQSGVDTVFLLGGDILSVGQEIRRIRACGKQAFMHIDLVDGIARDAAGVRYVARCIAPDGVISTKAALLRVAQEEGLTTVQRIFLVDSSSLETGARLVQASSPDYVEVMPGLVPLAITHLRATLRQPVIAGGMITQPEQVRVALTAGAVAVSTSSQALWHLADPQA